MIDLTEECLETDTIQQLCSLIQVDNGQFACTFVVVYAAVGLISLLVAVNL